MDEGSTELPLSCARAHLTQEAWAFAHPHPSLSPVIEIRPDCLACRAGNITIPPDTASLQRWSYLRLLAKQRPIRSWKMVHTEQQRSVACFLVDARQFGDERMPTTGH
jgi:hypothetical protein